MSKPENEFRSIVSIICITVLGVASIICHYNLKKARIDAQVTIEHDEKRPRKIWEKSPEK